MHFAGLSASSPGVSKQGRDVASRVPLSDLFDLYLGLSESLDPRMCDRSEKESVILERDA